MRQLVIVLGLLLTQIIGSHGDGHFYIGLLSYSVPEGEVCCQDAGTNVTCTPYCHLIFEVQIHGLTGPDGNLTYRLPSDLGAPLSPAEAATFQSGTSAQLPNPTTFDFVKWPGEVNVSILVFDQDNLGDPDSLLPVDEFSTTFSRFRPEVYYIRRDLNSSDSESKLQIVFRYDCGKTTGPECFTDCVDHDDNETCPVTSPTPISPEVTFTGFGKCETVDEKGVVVHRNCTSESTSTPTRTNAHTKPTFRDSGPTQSPKPNSTADPTSTSSITSTTTTTTTTTTTATPSTTKTSKVTTETVRTTSTTARKSDDPGATVTPDPTKGSTPDERSSKKDDDVVMKYWPAIVGGVLGGVAFIAAIGFCLYHRRQKKMRKRQEIYNVNPKVLRNFEEYAENGTSGRADVPLETEQY